MAVVAAVELLGSCSADGRAVVAGHNNNNNTMFP